MFAQSGFGQAYCVLRNPTREIKALAPECPSYRSVVRTIDKHVFDKMKNRLPNIPLYLAEMGRHTIYLPVKEGKATGIIHPRSIPTNKGLTDIVWEFDFNLRVRDFRFQRCRHRSREYLESAEFLEKIRGKDFDALRSLLNEKGDALKPGSLSLPPEAVPLATAVIQCALKAILCTEIAWGDALPSQPPDDT